MAFANLFGRILPNGGAWFGINGPYFYSIPGLPKCSPVPNAYGFQELGPFPGDYGPVSPNFIYDLFMRVKGFTNISISGSVNKYNPETIEIPNWCFPPNKEFVSYTSSLSFSASVSNKIFSGSREPCFRTTFSDWDYMKFPTRFPYSPQISDEAIFTIAPFSVLVQRTRTSTQIVPDGCLNPAWPIYEDSSNITATIKFSTGFIGYYDPRSPFTIPPIVPEAEGYYIRASVMIGPLPFWASPDFPFPSAPYGRFINYTRLNNEQDGFLNISTAEGILPIPIKLPFATQDFPANFNGSMTAYYE